MGLADLSTLDTAIRQPRPNAKPESRKRTKGRKLRAEGKVKKDVRQQVDNRDGPYCRVIATVSENVNDVGFDCVGVCRGPGEWAHMHAKRRSQTRGQAPERRHDTAHSLMLCQFHHQEYDAHRLHITALTRRGADGPLKFRRAK